MQSASLVRLGQACSALMPTLFIHPSISDQLGSFQPACDLWLACLLVSTNI
jgi:hypothetical protein